MIMEKHTGIFATSGAVREAVDNSLLYKPYMAIVEDGNYIDWNTAEIPVEPMRGVIYNDTAATEFRITNYCPTNEILGLPALTSVKIDGVEVINDLKSGETMGDFTPLYLDPTGYTEGEHTIEYRFANTVTTLPYFVFTYTNLVTITLPDSLVNLGAVQTFQDNKYLTGITIPSGVTQLTDNMFYGCTALTVCNILGMIDAIPNRCFYNTPSLKSTGLSMDTSNINTLYSYAFAGGAGIDTFTATALTGMGEYVFQSAASLTSVVLDGSYTSVGRNCFHFCTSLSSVTLNTAVTSFGISCFNNCHSLTSFVLPPNVTSIGNYCFNACTSLTSFTFNSVLESAGSYTFSLIPTGLDIRYPDSMKKISNNTFCGATMGDIYIPSGVTSLSSGFTRYMISAGTLEFEEGFNTTSGRLAIAGGTSTANTRVEKLIIPDSINGQVYTSYFSAKEIYVGGGVTNPGNFIALATASKIVYSDNRSGMTFNKNMSNNQYIEEIHFPPNTILSGDSSFGGFSESTIQKVNFENITGIYNASVFAGCSGLTGGVNLSNYTYTLLPNSTFTNTRISAVTINHQFDLTIGNYAFYGIPTLATATIRSTDAYLASLGDSAFANCTGLTNIVIMNILENDIQMGYSVFQGDTSLRDFVTMNLTGGSRQTIVLTGGTFNGCSSLESVYGPVKFSGSNTMGQDFMGCSSMTSVNLADGDYYMIPSATFSDCTGIARLTFPSCVTYVQDFGCNSMTSLTAVTLLNESIVELDSPTVFIKNNSTQIDIYVPASIYPSYMAIDDPSNPWFSYVVNGKVNSL